MIKRHPTFKLIKPPGIFVMALLPILCYTMFIDTFVRQIREERMVSVIVPEPKLLPEVRRRRENKSFAKIHLTGEASDQIKLQFLQIVVRKLIHQSDTTQGFEISLGDAVKFGSFVRLFEICEVEGVSGFVYFDDQFWIFNFPAK